MIKYILLFIFTGIIFPLEANKAMARPELVPSAWNDRFMDIKGSVAEFKADSSDVQIWIPDGVKNPPVMLYAHGGSGYRGSDQARVSIFRREGFVTISFDAFLMNGFGDERWVNRNLTLTAKQKMLFEMLKGAYAYARAQKEWNAESIWLYGQSNGARVVLAAQGNREFFSKIEEF